MATLYIPIVVPVPEATTTTVLLAPTFIDNEDLLNTTTTLGTTTTTSTAVVDLPADYNSYYQTAAYIDSMSDEELANLTTEIDNIILEDNQAKVHIKTQNNKI